MNRYLSEGIVKKIQDHKNVLEPYKGNDSLVLGFVLYLASPNDTSARLAFAKELTKTLGKEVNPTRLPFVV
jgi:hypothetical protein